jgi:hypothetical protein
MRVAKLIESVNDVALLKVDDPFKDPMCFITLTSDVFNTDGFRIGIPGGLEDPVPKEVVIGLDGEQWKPLVLLTPTPVEDGESGGPIIVDFNVVGIMKSKHKQYSGYSFMMKGSSLRNLMLKYRVALDGQMCNPVVIRMIGNSANVRADSNLSSEDQSIVLDQIQKAVSERLAAANAGVQVITENASVKISGLPQTVFVQSCTKLPFGHAICSSAPQVVYNPTAANAAASQAAAEIKDKASIELWNRLKN